MIIRHEIIAELTEAAEARGSTLVDWTLEALEMLGEHGPFGWRLLPCGCLVVEPLRDAIANMKPVTPETFDA